MRERAYMYAVRVLCVVYVCVCVCVYVREYCVRLVVEMETRGYVEREAAWCG